MGNLWLWYWGLGGVENSPCPLNCFLQCSWFGLFDHLAIQVGIHGYQHINNEHTMELLADEELVGMDDGVESGPITIIFQLWVSTSN